MLCDGPGVDLIWQLWDSHSSTEKDRLMQAICGMWEPGFLTLEVYIHMLVCR